MKYTKHYENGNKDIVFNNIKYPVFQSGGVLASEAYNVGPFAKVITDEQLPTIKLLNALDIDWGDAILPNSDLENGGPIGIQSTADLLKLIDDMNTHYISAIGAIYSLLPSQSVIMFNRNAQGELEGEETLSCQVNKIESDNIITYDLSDSNIELEDGLQVYYSDNTLDGEPVLWDNLENNEVTVAANSDINEITLVLKKSNTLLDLKTIPVMRASAKGAQGPQGVAGLNGLNGLDGAPGSNGQDGQYVVFAYKNSETLPQKPENSTTINNLINGWSVTPENPTPPEVTWMTQCLVNGSGQYGTWTPPIRITGAQGANGADGTNGEDGVDGINGSCVEFIYTRNNTGLYPSIPVAVNIETTDDWSGEDQNNIIWTDNPQGVQADMKWEFVSMRTKPAGATNWQAFSSPVIWSKWGETGMDGDGVEYIYKHFDTEKTFGTNNYNPAQWEAVQEDEYYGPTVEGIDYRWSDGPQGVNAEFQYEYVAVRKKKPTGWQAYSTPTLWAKYGPQGVQGAQGVMGQAGQDGQNGSHWVFAYKNSATQPDTIESGTSLEYSGWDASPVNPTPPAVTWMSQTLVDTNNQYGDWTDPIRITGAQGEAGADGTDGADGANGSNIEFIYKRFNQLQTFDNNYNTYDNPVAWSDLANENYQDTDYRGPEGHEWTDNPQGVQSDLMFEYVSTRVKPAGTNTTWGSFSTPVVWSKWGEKGQDGDGVEYIYKHFTESQSFTENDYNPAHWDASQTSGYQGIENFEWSDGPQGINAEYQYEYVSIRKKIDGTWGKFTVPVIWAKFNTAPTIEIRDGYWYIDGVNQNVQAEGQNGAGVEIKGVIEYDSDLVNDGHVTPKNGSQVMASKGDCYVCDDNGHIYMWNSLIWVDLGEFRGAPGQNGNDGTDGHSSYMHIAYATSITFENNTPVSAIGFTTVNTDNSSYDWIGFLVDENNIDSDNFADYKWNYVKGIDGNGYEYVYMRTKTSIRPEISDNLADANGRHVADDEYLPAVSNPNECQAEPSYDDNSQAYYQFTDDPHGVQSVYKYEWQSIRKKVNGSWDVFSTPALLAKWAEDGAQGAQGAQGAAGQNGIDGQSIEFIYKNYDINISSVVAPASNDYPPTGWFKAPQTPNGSQATWMSQRILNSTPVLAEWSTPICITGAQGNAGADGQNGTNGVNGRYVEFIYHTFNSVQQFGNDVYNPVTWINLPNENYQNYDYVGPTNNQWTDNPTGVDANNKYEYVSQREFDGTSFGPFSTPVIWSKWGEKGQDGDGVEYIYKHFETIQDFDIADKGSINYNNPACWEAQALVDGYQGPIVDGIDYRWSDGPQGISNQLPYEYVAVRKKKSTGWQSFSKPTLWAKYGPQGAQGVAGTNGINGQNGKAGLWYDYAGEWTEGKSVTNTEQIGYYVSIGNQFYMNVKDNGIANNIIPVNNGELNEGWQSMSNDRNYYIGKAFFGEYAAFGSAIINEDWMISKNGTINGTPYNNGEHYVGGETYPNLDAAAYTLFDPQYPDDEPKYLGFNGTWGYQNIMYDTLEYQSYNEGETNPNEDVYIIEETVELQSNKIYNLSLYLYNNYLHAYDYKYCIIDPNGEYLQDGSEENAGIIQGINGVQGVQGFDFETGEGHIFTDNREIFIDTFNGPQGTYKIQLIKRYNGSAAYMTDLQNNHKLAPYYYAYIKPDLVFVPAYALNLLSGKVYENDLHVKGIIKANALYPQNMIIYDDIDIDPKSNLAYTYIINGDEDDDTVSIKLPNAKFNKDLELRFYVESGNANINFSGQKLYTPVPVQGEYGIQGIQGIRKFNASNGTYDTMYWNGVGKLPKHTLTTMTASYAPERRYTEESANVHNQKLETAIDIRDLEYFNKDYVALYDNGDMGDIYGYQVTFKGGDDCTYSSGYQSVHSNENGWQTFSDIFTNYNNFISIMHPYINNQPEGPQYSYIGETARIDKDYEPLNSGFQGAQMVLDVINEYNGWITGGKKTGDVRKQSEYAWHIITGYVDRTISYKPLAHELSGNHASLSDLTPISLNPIEILP